MTDVVIIPVNGFGFAQQRFFPPRLRYGFVSFSAEAVVQQILKVSSFVSLLKPLMLSNTAEGDAGATRVQTGCFPGKREKV